MLGSLLQSPCRAGGLLIRGLGYELKPACYLRRETLRAARPASDMQVEEVEELRSVIKCQSRCFGHADASQDSCDQTYRGMLWNIGGWITLLLPKVLLRVLGAVGMSYEAQRVLHANQF